MNTMTQYIKNIHALRRVLAQDYGQDAAKTLRLVRNPYRKSILHVQTPSGFDLDQYQHAPNLGWFKQ